MKIGGTTCKNPTDFEVSIENLYGTARKTANGSTVASRIAVKRRISVTWKWLTQTEVSALMTALSPTYFTVEYQDPISGVVTKTFKIDTMTTPRSLIKRTVVMWDELSCELIER